MSTDWLAELEPDLGPEVTVIETAGFPPPRHEAESDWFARQSTLVDQEALSKARVTIVGAGGLGSWVALGLVRSGVSSLTLIDHDVIEPTNGNRQLVFGDDVGKSKAQRVAQNVAAHMLTKGQVTAIRMPFADAVASYALAADLFIVLVDNNSARLQVSRYARAAGLPAIFGMVSTDGTRLHVFLQGADDKSPCLRCALPDLDPDSGAPCASATIATSFVAAAHVVFLAHRTLTGWAKHSEIFNWREADLSGMNPERTGKVLVNRLCALCR